MRVLIVGADIGGMTLAALLKQRKINNNEIHDVATKFYSLEYVASLIVKAFDEPI